MWEKYKETFDGVHASQRLKTEVLNMKREENLSKKRRIPAAALVAAVLVVVLAGTAMAAGHLGRVRIEPINSWLGPDGPVEGSGYTVTHENTCFPAENLSDEVFAIGEEIGDVHRPHRMLPFGSWAACEDFLGVELANNSRLGQMQRKRMRVDEIGQDTYAYVSLGYENLMPSYVNVTACYREGNDVDVMQSVQLRTQYAPEHDPEQWDYQIPQNGEEPPTYETYVTAAGVEATIFTETYDTPISTYTNCYASFIRDNMRFSLNVSVRTHEDQEPTNAPDTMELTKEILDAYETDAYGMDYAIYGNCDRIPAESLSDEVLSLAAEASAQGDGMIMTTRDFASFPECESFLGLELADNPKLEQPWYEDGKPAASTVSLFSYQQMLSSVRVDSFYEVNGYRINAYALLRTENSRDTVDYDIRKTARDGAAFEDYVTPNGMTATIFTEESAHGECVYTAYFTRNNALFMVALLDGNTNAGTALDTLKEILDAYE